MSYWLIVLAALMFGLYNVFIKLSAEHIQAVLGAVILQFVAAFIGLGLLLYMQRSGGEPLQVSVRGIGLAVLAGVSIGVVEIATFFIYGQGVPVAVGNPLIIGGSLLVTTSIGVFALREVMTPIQLTAILMIAGGVGLLAIGAARSVPS